MEDDILKTWASDDSSMAMMAMMMQTEKFPELCEPFYNTSTLSYAENELSCGSSSSTTTLPFFSNVNPNVTPPPPTLINPLLFNNPLQHPMTPSLQLQPNNEVVVPSGRLRINPYPSTENKRSSVAAMREMIFRIAVMQPVHIDPESIKPPKRRNVKISKDPQSVAARHRRERISERIRILQRLVPGGTKMDTASMLDEAIHYVKFLKKQVQTLEQAGATRPLNAVVGFPGGGVTNANVNYPALVRSCQPCQMLANSPSKQMLS